MKIILASASPRRKELIRHIFDVVEVIPADIDESIPPKLSAKDVPSYLSEQKALFLASDHPTDLIIAADTVVISDDKILGKPRDTDDARRMLKALSGREHEVITGCTLALNGSSRSFSVSSRVHFYPLNEAEINAYIETGEPMDKAGSYGIQGKGSLFVKEIHGDYFNIVGLPVAKLNQEIKDFLTKVC